MLKRLLTACALLLALAGCTPAEAGIQETPAASATPEPTPEPTPTAPAQLAVGDCTGPLGEAVSSSTAIAAVDCDKEHAYEVFSITELTTPELPSADALRVIANNRCLPAFTKFVGVEPAYSRYSSVYLAPDEASWQIPELRKITCLVGSEEGGLKGSARDDTTLFPTVGQCTGPQDVPVLEIDLVNCKKEHSYEVYAAKKITSKKAPSGSELTKLVNQVCVAEFKKFVGVDAAASKYEFAYLIADADLWDNVEDHRLVCSVGSPKGGIKGSLEDAKA